VPSCAPTPLGTSDCNVASFPLIPVGVLVLGTARLDSTPLLPTGGGGDGEGCEVGPGNVSSCCGAASAIMLYQSCMYRSFSSGSSRVSGNHAAVSSAVRPLVPGRSRSEGGTGLWCAWGCYDAPIVPQQLHEVVVRVPLEGARTINQWT
jgi:hypothetical protein